MKKLLLLILTMFTLSGCTAHTVNDTRNDQIQIVEQTDQSDDDADDSSSEEATDQDTAADDASAEPKIYEAEDVVGYFNALGEEYGIKVEYVEEHNYYYLHYIHTSKETPQDANNYFLTFLPLYKVKADGYLFKYKEKYKDEVYTYVAVSSNFFAATTLYSYIENEELITEVLIYDGRHNIYE